MKTLCSQSSVKRFIKLFYGINETPYWFHQTLTCGETLTAKQASQRLKTLLDCLEKAYSEMACLFVREYQENQNPHFHVIFMFFSSQASPPVIFMEHFRKYVFKRWNKNNKGNLVRVANKMTLRKRDYSCIRYLLWDIDPRGKGLPRQILWHGVRKRKIIKENSSPVLASDVKKHYLNLFPMEDVNVFDWMPTDKRRQLNVDI